jgi:DNA-binding winged helix-turn-helix (wHTH) protein/tetratricopeptide (TPR) repeat protein
LKETHRLPPNLPVSRLPETEEAESYAFGPFRLLPEEQILRRGDRELPLPPKAFETLLLLVRNPGHLLLKDDLMKALWPDTFVEDVNLANKISTLRKALEDTGATSKYIQTVPKMGYRFTGAITRLWKSGPPTSGVSLPVKPPDNRAIRFIALPFTLHNGDERMAFLAHSLPEAISGSLAGLRSLTVRSALLGARLAEQDQDPRRIAREADVDMLLAGSILCDGDRLRVTAELVQAPGGTLVGSYVCTASWNDIFDIQESLVRRIVELLLPSLSEHEHKVLTHDVPATARAYEFYLRGSHMERQRTFENMSMARDLYRQSLDEDPDYAPAWARLGRCYRFLEKFDPQVSADSDLTHWAFRRAFALNPDLPIAHNHYTQIEADSGHARRAMTRLLRQAERHPNDPELFSGLVQATRYCGLLEESLLAHQNARRCDSRAVTSVAHTYFLLGDYPRTLEWYPPGGRFYLDAAVAAAEGREKEAVDMLTERHSLAPLVESLYHCLRGDHAQSTQIAKQGLGSKSQDPEIRFYLARHLARDGAEQDALDTVRDLVDRGFFCSTALRVDPWLTPLARLADFDGVMESVLRREEEAREACQAAEGRRVLSL